MQQLLPITDIDIKATDSQGTTMNQSAREQSSLILSETDFGLTD